MTTVVPPDTLKLAQELVLAFAHERTDTEIGRALSIVIAELEWKRREVASMTRMLTKLVEHVEAETTEIKRMLSES